MDNTSGRPDDPCRWSAASEPEALVTFFGECGMKMERVGLAAWRPDGGRIPAFYIEACQAEQNRRNDASVLAQIMRTGCYRAVHVKISSCQS